MRWRDGPAVESFPCLPEDLLLFPATTWWLTTILNSPKGNQMGFLLVFPFPSLKIIKSTSPEVSCFLHTGHALYQVPLPALYNCLLSCNLQPVSGHLIETVLLFPWDKVSLCSSGWLRTLFINQDGHKLSDPPALPPEYSVGVKTGITMPSLLILNPLMNENSFLLYGLLNPLFH